MSRDHDAIRQELDRLKADGLIHPADVVNAARNEDSPLHPLFQWDDGEAAHQYRLLQARKVLQVYVVVQEAEGRNVRAFVSLTSDRVQGGGYRAMTEVMSDDDMRAQLLHDALVQLQNMRKKYKGLQELYKVWSALDEVELKAKDAA